MRRDPLHGLRHRIATLIIVVIVVAQILACKPSDPFSYIQISGEIVLDTNEQKLDFVEPFKASKQVNEVCFEYSELLKVDYVDKPPVFPDGKPLLIVARLTDQSGSTRELNSIVRNRPGYLCLAPKGGEWWYKTDVKFTALTVQSNRRISLSKIEWKMYNAWDMK